MTVDTTPPDASLVTLDLVDASDTGGDPTDPTDPLTIDNLTNATTPNILISNVSVTDSVTLYNDDVNTFDHVIETLIYACEHTPEQAEQCSILVHYKGKCTVKTGTFDELEPKCSLLLDAGLSAEII